MTRVRKPTRPKPKSRAILAALKRQKKQNEDRAIEAIIACVLRGFDKDDWDKVFKRMDEMNRQAKLEAQEYMAKHGNDIYGKP